MVSTKMVTIIGTPDKVISTTDIEFDVINIVWLKGKGREAVSRGDIVAACVPVRERSTPVALSWRFQANVVMYMDEITTEGK